MVQSRGLCLGFGVLILVYRRLAVSGGVDCKKEDAGFKLSAFRSLGSPRNS